MNALPSVRITNAECNNLHIRGLWHAAFGAAVNGQDCIVENAVTSLLTAVLVRGFTASISQISNLPWTLESALRPPFP